MLGRALRLATVTLLTGCLTAVAVHALENLEAGKTPAQIFSGTCNACHKSPRGLLKSVSASSLPGFLRQHYTTSSDMASVLSSYLVANGATDTRPQGRQGKDGAKDGTKEASRTPADGAKRPPRAVETTDPMRPDLIRPEPPPQAAHDKGKKDKGKKGRSEETARTESAAEPPKEAARAGEGTKPAAEPKVDTAKVEPAKEAVGEPAATRPDPVPAVTPAPTTSAAAPATSNAAPGASSVPPVQPLDGPSVVEPLKSIIELPKPPAVAAAPALPPVPPAGPPTVPISQ